MDTLRLPVRIVQYRGEGPHLRQLKLTCAITNPTATPFCVLGVWIIVEALGGLKLAEGSLFHMEHALAYPPVIRQGAEGTGIITIDLPSPLLHALEQRRRGGDLAIRISSRVLVCQVLGDEEQGALGWPIQTLFESGRTGEIEHVIPQWEWVRLLAQMGWTEIQLLELPSHDIRADARLSRALKRLEDAQDCYRRGLWEESITNCRKLFEAVVKDVSGHDSMDHALEVMESLVTHRVKAQKINEITVALSAFLHLARHEQLPEVAMGPSDAAFALQMSAGLLAYLAAP